MTELVRAGLSRTTVLAMEPWKAREVLDLLHSAQAGEGRHRGSGWGGRVADFAPRPGQANPPAGPLLGFSTQD